jgi:hypothetical protein
VTSLNGHIKLDESASELLVQQVPNELINGFEVEHFDLAVSVSEPELTALASELRDSREGASIELNFRQARVLRQALAVVLAELGPSEFQTRTGHAFEEGWTVHRQLDDFLASDTATAVNDSEGV